MTSLKDFKTLYKRFFDAMRYIIDQKIDPEKEPNRWKLVTTNFYEKFEKPMDEAWNDLPEELKDQVAYLYLKEKAKQDATVQKAIKVFDAKIIKVSRQKPGNMAGKLEN